MQMPNTNALLFLAIFWGVTFLFCIIWLASRLLCACMPRNRVYDGLFFCCCALCVVATLSSALLFHQLHALWTTTTTVASVSAHLAGVVVRQL